MPTKPASMITSPSSLIRLGAALVIVVTTWPAVLFGQTVCQGRTCSDQGVKKEAFDVRLRQRQARLAKQHVRVGRQLLDQPTQQDADVGRDKAAMFAAQQQSTAPVKSEETSQPTTQQPLNVAPLTTALPRDLMARWRNPQALATTGSTAGFGQALVRQNRRPREMASPPSLAERFLRHHTGGV